MVEYCCERCDKVFKKKYNYTKHLNRKNPCKKIVTDKKIKCDVCGVNFTTEYNLKRHIDSVCMKESSKDKLIEKLINMISNNMNFNNGIINNNTTNIETQNITNNQQNINLVAFGEEDLSFISDKVCEWFLDRGFKSVPHLIEYVHFNKKYPQFHNIYLPNLRQNVIVFFDNDKWKTKNKNEVIEQLINDKLGFLTDKFEELQDNLKDSAKRKFGRFLNEHNSNNKVNEKLKDDIKLILYNGRNLHNKKLNY